MEPSCNREERDETAKGLPSTEDPQIRGERYLLHEAKREYAGVQATMLPLRGRAAAGYRAGFGISTQNGVPTRQSPQACGVWWQMFGEGSHSVSVRWSYRPHVVC